MQLKPKQREALDHLAAGRSVFAALPTGYGKSMLYALPARDWGWRVIVISPLVSLIEDQALALDSLGVPVAAWTGGLPITERARLTRLMLSGGWRLCLLSPERFVAWSANGFLQRLALPDLVAIDEMHCLDDWRDFRGGYRNLETPLRGLLARGVPLLGLSASWPIERSEHWMTRLASGHARVEAPLGRENLALRVLPLETTAERWLSLVAALRGLRAPESALVYCFSRDETDDVARWLRSAGIAAVAYHAGLPVAERSERTRSFRAGRLRVVCATSAFGMGIDYPHVSRVIHFSMPRDLESYWQEVGRAGRAGGPALGTALWRRSEITRARVLDAPAREKFFVLWKAWASGACRKVAIAQRLGLDQEPCGNCDRCDTALAYEREAWWARDAQSLHEWIEERREEAHEVKRAEQNSLELRAQNNCYGKNLDGL